MVDLIPAIVERLYGDLASTKPPQSHPVQVDSTAKKIEWTRADVDPIIQRTRGATAEELGYIISHAKEFSLTDGQRDPACCDLTIAAAHRPRQGNGRRIDANAEFIGKVLGLCETPCGLIERKWINARYEPVLSHSLLTPPMTLRSRGERGTFSASTSTMLIETDSRVSV